ncbi:MAG TPA: hypothetical protein VK700_21775 [Steroidobacteraceae bacterium]|jgi:hypothetical protein|nr:hypothetical protein [Steroidobacteraceae bacterium]
MISKQARSSIDYLFTEAARSSLVLHPDDACSIEPVVKEAGIAASLPGTVLVITCSSFIFRFLTLLRLGDNSETRAYYAQGASAEENSADALFEAANLCTGAINRGLSRHFPHVGMSTPYALSDACLSHLQDLQPQDVLSYQITIRDSVRLQATVCLCSYAPIDFTVNRTSASDAAATGELEFFE